MTHDEETRNFLEPPAGGAAPEESRPVFDYDDENDGYPSGCYICGGAGFIITCIDDLCRGAGECMHGDGESPCPNGCDWNL